jgi:hypothetical protein
MEECRKLVLQFQEDRTKTFAEFEAGYVTYLEGGDEKDYTSLCTRVTEKFGSASNQIRHHEEELKKTGADKLCGWIRKLQEGEQAHLNLCIALQVERKRAKMINEEREKSKGHECSHSHGHGHEHEHEENEEDLLAEIQDSKVKWLKDQLDEVMTQINEAIDEIRYWEDE